MKRDSADKQREKLLKKRRQTLLDERELKVKVILYSSCQVQPMNRQLPGCQAPFHFVRDWVRGVRWLGHEARSVSDLIDSATVP